MQSEDSSLEVPDGVCYEPVFAGREVPVHWRGRFGLIRELLERWHGIELGLVDMGDLADEVAAVERELGRPLPASVKEWMLLNEELGRRDDMVYDSRHPQIVPEQDVLLLKRHLEGHSFWAIKRANLTGDDPPVDCWGVNYIEGVTYPRRDDPLVADTTTEFALRFFLDSHIGGSFTVDRERDREEIVKELESQGAVVSRFGGFSFIEGRGWIIYWFEHSMRVALQDPVYAERLPGPLLEDGFEYLDGVWDTLLEEL